jgi:hypothetical protein
MIQDNRPACWPAQFHPQPLPLLYCPDPTLAEQPLFEQARRGEAVAQIWQAPQGVVPGSYRKFSELSAVSALFPAAAGRCGFAAPAVAAWSRRAPGLSISASPGRSRNRWAKRQNLSITALRAFSARWRRLASGVIIRR